MINQVLACEKEYKRQFSDNIEFEDYVLFEDQTLPDMHSHNCCVIKNKKDNEVMIKMINHMINDRKRNEKSFLQVEMDFPLNSEIISKLSVKPKLSTFYYMGQEIRSITNPEGNQACKIKKAVNLDILIDGIHVDIEANKKVMGVEFARKRGKRKLKVYEDPTRELDLYVCYLDTKAVGNCELLLYDEMAKIEDFDIIESYQGKRLGTALLNFVMNEAIVNGATYIYLLTDANDSVKDMYKKFGLEVLLTRTELFFNLQQ